MLNLNTSLQTQAHSSTTEKYGFISTKALVDALAPFGWVVAAESKARLTKKSLEKGKDGFQKHWVSLVQEGDPDLRKVGDSEFRIMIYNSHMGSSSLRIQAGVYRLVCSNGLVIPTSVMGEARIHHRLRKDETYSPLKRAMEEVFRIAAQIDDVRKAQAALKAKKVTREEQIMYAAKVINVVFPDGSKSHFDPAAFLQTRRQEDTSMDLWSTLNIVQENLTRGSIRAFDSSGNQIGRATRGITQVERNREMNEQVFSIAMEMVA